MKKLTGSLITDFENIQTEYYCLACVAARNKDKNKAKLYYKCYEIMNTVLRIISKCLRGNK